MKKLISLVLLMLFFVTMKSQDLNIIGKWKVNCTLQKNENGSLHVCDLCPSAMLNNNTAIIEEFEIEFTATAIKWQNEEVSIEIPYEIDKAINKLKFKYAQKEYAFKAMIVSDPFVQILVAETGEVLYLKKLL
ncbi:MAG: hypothetical protein ACK50A_17425 [Sphingobacteriaceae bacterium]